MLAALLALQSRKDIDRDQIGLIGVSQAGWVIPQAARSGEAAFAITLSGGLNDTANLNQVLLLRNEGNNLNVHQIDADKILASEIPDVYLSQNDVVFIPRTKIADVGIFVDQYVNSIVPDFIRVSFNINNQIGTVKTKQDTLLVNPQ